MFLILQVSPIYDRAKLCGLRASALHMQVKVFLTFFQMLSRQEHGNSKAQKSRAKLLQLLYIYKSDDIIYYVSKGAVTFSSD